MITNGRVFSRSPLNFVLNKSNISKIETNDSQGERFSDSSPAENKQNKTRPFKSGNKAKDE